MLTCQPQTDPPPKWLSPPSSTPMAPPMRPERHGLDQKLRQDVLATRAHSHAQADLARALGHASPA